MKTTKRILATFAVAVTAFAVFTACNASDEQLNPSVDGGVKNSSTDSFSSNSAGDDVLYLSELKEAYGDALVEAPANYENHNTVERAYTKLYVYEAPDGTIAEVYVYSEDAYKQVTGGGCSGCTEIWEDCGDGNVCCPAGGSTCEVVHNDNGVCLIHCTEQPMA